MGNLSLELEKGLYLGIDFGTTNSVVSIYQYDTDQIHTLDIEGYTIFPSVIQFEYNEETDSLDRVFGFEAKEAAMLYSKSTIISVKRHLESEEPIKIQVEEKEYSFEAVTVVSELLAYLKQKADEYIRDELNISGVFSGCVITVPANSTDKQKRKMQKAAIMAGFMEEQVFLRLEPAAAAISYATMAQESKNILVYDFGGGTFDACLLEIIKEEEAEPRITIRSTYGDNHLGGDDLDQLLVDLIYSKFLETVEGTIDLYSNQEDGLGEAQKKAAIVRMKQTATSIKEKLSTAKVAKVVLAPFIQRPEPVNLSFEVTRDMFMNHARAYPLDDEEKEFERMKGKTAENLIDKTMICIEKCLESGGMSKEDIDDIFLVGGSSAVPQVRTKVTQVLGKEPYQSMISPALSISRGAAHYCHQIMLPSMTGPKVHEKTVHSLGIETAGRRYLEVISRGMDIPLDGLTIEAPYLLETNFDNLSSLAIVIYEDVEPDPLRRKYIYEKGMRRLAGTALRGIPAGPKGEQKIKIFFHLSQDNILTIEAISTSIEEVKTSLTVDELYEK